MNCLPLVLLVVITGICSVLLKLIINKLPKTKALFVQYLFCFIFVSLFWAVFDRTIFSVKSLLIIGVGIAFLNYVGAYCQWTAYKINMSRTSLFFPWISVLAIVFFCVFLKEHKQLSLLAISGVSLHLLAIWLFKKGQIGKKRESKNNFQKWLFFTIGMIVTSALVDFLMKVLSFDISKTHFLFCWYMGSFVFSSFALFSLKEEETKPFQKNIFFFVPLCSLSIMMNLLCLYWAFQLNSGTLVISFYALILTFIPALVGWFIFGEWKGISKTETAGFLCGIVAAVLILSSH